jgi:flagellar protein FlaG
MIIQQSNAVASARGIPDERPSPSSASSHAAATPAPASTPAPEQVKQAAQVIGRAMQTLARNLQFSVDDSSGETIVKVVDMETGNVIRQMPSQEALDISKAIDRLQGLLLRQKA